MRTCFLKIGGDVDEHELELDGYGGIAGGTVCQARKPGGGFFAPSAWRYVRIVRKVDHIGGKQNHAGAVYEAVDLGPGKAGKPRDRTGGLFG